jgi:hypothetical protein
MCSANMLQVLSVHPLTIFWVLRALRGLLDPVSES